MERTAISGISGFIGSHLSERFNSEQCKALGRDGFVPECDVIFDFAAFGNMAGQDDIAETYKANLMRVIEENKYIDDQKWIYISTSSVMLPVQTPYSLSKKAAEEFLKYTGKKVAIARPLSITGVGEQKEHLIPKLIDSCLNGTEIPFVKEPVHDFLDVDDFVEGLLIIKDKGLFKGEVYEIGSGIQTSNDDVRLIVEALTGKKANIKLVDNMRKYDTSKWQADTERISSLGWKPKKSLFETIDEMIQYER